VEARDRVDWVTIDRAGDRNALDSETLAQLGAHLEDAEGRGVRAIVYEGAGDEYFVGGADGVEMHRFTPQEARDFSRRIHALFRRMEASPILLVAAIDGLCFGGGLEFALACDVRIASARSRAGLPEVKLGIIPGGGGTQRLPRVIGMGRATEMILTGRLLGADEALDAGLVHRVVPVEGLRAEAEAWVARALRIPVHAFAAAKQATKVTYELPLERGLKVETERFAGCFENCFFADCVREQLANGRLETTRQDERKGSVDGDG